MSTTFQNPCSSSPKTPILGVSQVTVPLTSHVTMQPLVQSLPQASSVQSIPTILSTPQIPFVQPSIPHLQVPFQVLPFQGLPQIQFFQRTPFQTQFI